MGEMEGEGKGDGIGYVFLRGVACVSLLDIRMEGDRWLGR